jgi:quercetin dioxygenase-like cupin family protein
VNVSAVRFTPSARTAWHSHAVGQTLYVAKGKGLHQPATARSRRSAPGDVIYTPAEEWYWHSAAPDHFMTHLSITEAPETGDRRRAGAST